MKNKTKYKIILFVISCLGFFLAFHFRAEALYIIKTKMYPQYVATVSGNVSILDLKVGDRVLGYNADTKTPSVNTLEKVDYHITNGKFYIFNGNLVLFENQTIYTNGRFIHAKDVKVGDALRNIAGEIETVQTLEETSGPYHFYRLQISGDHTYYINDILVHNASRYWVGGGSSANWNAITPTNWGTASNTQDDASVPGVADDVIFDNSANGNSPSTLSAGISINSLDMSAYTNTFTHNASVIFNIDGNGVNYKLGSGMTYTLGVSGSETRFRGTSGITLITTAGKTLGKVSFTGSGGSWRLEDSLTVSGGIVQDRGTIDFNDFNVTATFLESANTVARTLSLGNGTVTLTTGTTAPWQLATSTNMTLNAEGSTIKLTGTLTAARNFACGGLTYNNFWNATSGAFAIVITGANTFNDFKIDAGRTQHFTAGTTTTLSSLTATGASTVITSDTAATHTLSKASGTVTVQNVTISYSVAEGGATWNAFTSDGNVDGGNNTGWNFTAPAAATVAPDVKIRGGVNVRGGVKIR